LIGWGASALSGRAGGGPVSAGTPYMVGEEGPELFMPSASGIIAPRGAGSGGGVSITVNNTSGADVSVGRASQSQDGGMSLEIMVTRAVKNVMRSDLANYGDISQGMARRFGLDGTRGLA
jgi:phage-related minor tail protein